MYIWTVIGFSVGLLVILLLFRVESKRGDRLVLSRARAWLDDRVTATHYRLTHVSIHMGTGAMRLMFHFVVHRVLAAIMGVLHIFEHNVMRLEQRNRKVAKTIRDEQTKTHLDLIAEHKESNALSADEKQKLKDQAIEP